MPRITLCCLLISAEQVLLFTAHKSIHSNRGMRDSETEMVNEMNKAEDGKSYNKDDEEREISLSSPAFLALICVLQTEQNQAESVKQKRKENQSVYAII